MINMKRFRKNVTAIALSITMMFTTVLSVSAQENKNNEELVTVHIQGASGWIMDEEGNYSNPETGEYVRWFKNGQARTTAWTFEYHIQQPYTSIEFEVKTMKVLVNSSACVSDKYGSTYGDYSFDYSVGIKGILTRTLSFNTCGTQHGTISSLVPGGTYSVVITPESFLPYDRDGDMMYLTGSLEVHNND